MEEWGSLLLKYYNKNSKLKDNDYMINYLSYWTDNGAYYYWLTESNKNYEETILDVIESSKNNKIPFYHLYPVMLCLRIQLDNHLCSVCIDYLI